MTAEDNQKYSNKFKIYFNSLFQTEEETSFINIIKNSTDSLVFGGIIRDYFKNDYEHRDIDIVVKSNNIPLFKEEIGKFIISENRFGGFKLLINNKSIDLWFVEETWAIKNFLRFNSISLPGIEYEKMLPLTVFFDITAAVYSITEEKLYMLDGFISFIENKKKVLNIVLEDNPFPALCIIKAFEYTEKYNLDFSKDLKAYILKYYKIKSDELISTQIKHYGYLKFSMEQLNTLYYSLLSVPIPSLNKLHSDQTKNNQTKIDFNKDE